MVYLYTYIYIYIYIYIYLNIDIFRVSVICANVSIIGTVHIIWAPQLSQSKTNSIKFKNSYNMLEEGRE